MGGEHTPIEPTAGLAPASDETLIARLKGHDDDALRLLFHRYKRVVFSICLRILRDNAEAEDLTQDVFLYIQRRCETFDSSKSSGGSWIVHAAYQKAIDRRRYLTTRHFYNRKDIQDGASYLAGKSTLEGDYSPDTVFGRNGLQKILDALSENQRETLRLFFFEGYTFTEISETLGQPLGTVRHHYYRGLKKIRKQMLGRKFLRGKMCGEVRK